MTVVLLGTVFVSSGVAQDSFGDCSVSFDPREASFEADGGMGETTFTLIENPATAPSSCPGSMDMLASDVPWITITDVDLVGSLIGMTGRMVKGPLKFSVDPLGLSGSRQGTISARVDLTAGGSIRTAFVVTQVVTQSACTPAPAGLVSWWPLDETSGTAAADIVDGNPGTHIDGPTPTPGVVAGGLSFDGVDDYVRIPDAANLNPGTSDFSVDFWMKTSSQPTGSVGDNILSKRPICNVASFWDIRLGGATGTDGRLRVELIEEGAANSNFNASTIKVNDGQWHHIAVVREGPTSRLYIDGALDTSNTGGGTTNISNNVDILAGNGPCVGVDGTTFFDGELDEIEYFDVALSSAQVQAIYDAGSAGKCKPFSGGTVSPTVGGIVSSASFAPNAPAAPGSILAVFGQNFGMLKDGFLFPSTQFEAEGVSVLFDGTAAPLFGVFGDTPFPQINVLAPTDLPEMGQVQVEVTNSAGTSDVFILPMAPASTGIYRADPVGRMYAAALVAFDPDVPNRGPTRHLAIPASTAVTLGIPTNCKADGVAPLADCGEPVSPGVILQIFVTGLGKATPGGDLAGDPLPAGEVAPGVPAYNTVETPVVTMGGIPARVDFSGLAPGFSGLYQINALVPVAALPGDQVPLTIRMPSEMEGDTSNIAIAAP